MSPRHPVPERVVVVAAVAYRQEIAVFGVKHEEKPVEQDQRCVAHFGQRGFGICLGQCPNKVREDLLEDQDGQAAGDPFLMEASFLDRPLVKRSLVRRVGKEGIPPEHQPEHPEPVSPDIGRDGVVAIARHPENRRQIKLEELFGDRARARVVQTPAGAVRQNAPPELAGGLVVDAAEVAQHLRRGRGLLAPPPGATVQRSKPPFRFHDREAVLVALPLLGEAVRPVLRGAVGEQASRPARLRVRAPRGSAA